MTDHEREEWESDPASAVPDTHPYVDSFMMTPWRPAFAHCAPGNLIGGGWYQTVEPINAAERWPSAYDAMVGGGELTPVELSDYDATDTLVELMRQVQTAVIDPKW